MSGYIKIFKESGLIVDIQVYGKKPDEIDKKYRKSLNVMRAIAGKEWGVEKTGLLMIYKAMIYICV